MHAPIEWTHLGPGSVDDLPASVVFAGGGPHYLLGRGRRITRDVALVRVRQSPVTVSDSARQEVVTVLFLLDGELTFTGSRHGLRAGQAAFVRGPLAEHHASMPVDSLQVTVSIDSLRPLGVAVDSLDEGVPLASHLITPLRAFFTALLNTPEPDGTEDATADSVLQVLAVLLLQNGRGPQRPQEASRVERARRVLETTASDPGTTPASVAAELGVSVRTLQRDFRLVGSSLAGELRVERLRLAHELLREGRRGSVSIREAANRSGFTSTRHLRGAMKAQLGATPRTVRSGGD
ncbi:helix-turn-helix domain-containing protein [Rathayibacter sp. VKM Ac-2803]|uniref:helix-turn-helix domain-containing protein n=1 Tax=unclassified Rathayibacter TaxID=2609250 RepID=UPI00135859F3|nr:MULTISPECIES: helix-turn-helix domain-containing protein [unclassified Rathayibacter]MWV50343.1 helix-turn-helix domain-containing protein [Rathayibacter sp. VKM Ac-2803]MWV60500.1 helix-turn-helix domain-containing protein [Rathayibacter sp. VKM Ac-2754]